MLRNTQNLFLKDERPSYSYLLSYILYLDRNKHITTTSDLIRQLHGPITLCPFNNVLPQILELIDRVTHILYGVNATIESSEECLVAYRECGEKRRSMTRFILSLMKDLFSYDDWRHPMALFLQKGPFPAELVKQRKEYAPHWAAIFDQLAHANATSDTLSCLLNHENYGLSLLCHVEEIGGEQLFNAIIRLYKINVSLRFAVRYNKWFFILYSVSYYI